MIEKIEYEDKVAIQNDETVPEKSKVTDNNLNEIKRVVNNNADELTTANGNIANIQKEQKTQGNNLTNLQKSVNTNTKNIETNAKSIENNTKSIEINAKNIETNTKKIDTNTTAIKENTKDIRTNADAIELNASDIKDLQAENTALKTELEKQKEDNKLNGLTEDNEGELIHITDATGARFNSIEIQGNQKQDVTEKGKNLIPTNVAYWESGQYSADNGEKVNNSTRMRLINLIECTSNTNYYVVREPLIIRTYDASKNFVRSIGLLNAGNTFTTDEDENYLSITIAVELEAYIETTNQVGLYLSSETDKSTWVEGVPNSPSFDYPSEIKAVEDNIHLKICNKNILDTNKINSTLSGVKIESDLDGSLNISGTPTKKFISIKSKIKLDYPIKTGTKISFLFGKSVDLQKDSELTPFLWASDENDNNAGNINTSSDDFSIIASRDVTNITWGIEGFDTSTNYNTKLYLMLVTGDITQNKYIQREEQNYVIPLQQKMLSGDKFIKVNGEWKEMHTWLELFFDGVNRKFNQEATNTSGKYRLLYHISEKVKDCDTTNGTKAYCSNSKLTAKGETYSCNEGFTVANNIIYIYIDGRTASAINAELQDNQITFYIPLKEDDYKYLDCTEEQIEILDKIEKEAHTYLNTTNIYTEDEIGAIIKTNTNVDLSKMINNVVEAQLSQIGG